MGIHVDLESNAAEVPKVGEPVKVQKIYPNDPCPCGSGKKYMKCCGRNVNFHRLNHAVTATQKEILKAFGINEINIKKWANEISDKLV